MRIAVISDYTIAKASDRTYIRTVFYKYDTIEYSQIISNS
ncbi:hypothetical protein FDUTEX481_10140 [Tolypothrix sp. PCC 7601]|nr:hypothetical protein FDUTEX481_10140 [Tolypothrix sp. PCC 7601]